MNRGFLKSILFLVFGFFLIVLPKSSFAAVYCKGSTSYTFDTKSCVLDYISGCQKCATTTNGGSGTATCNWNEGHCQSASDVVMWCNLVDCNTCTTDRAGYFEGGDCWTCTSVDGGWSDCALKCGQVRSCNNPAPSCHGADCPAASKYCSSDDSGNPVAPTLIAPIGSSTDPIIETPTQPLILSWNAASKADKYNILVTNLETGVTLWQDSVGTSAVIVGLPLGHTYSWQVRGVNTTCGTQTGVLSALGYFMTD